MATAKQATTKRLNMAQRAQQQMEVHFPDVPNELLWRRKQNDGFTTIPRTLPIVMQAADYLSKGKPVGHTLFCLWARSPDHPLISVENPLIFAAEAGFTGERAVDTWRKRMKKLVELNLIRAKPGASGDLHYILLLNPNVAMEAHRKAGAVQDALYGRFIERAAEIGALREVLAIRQLWEEEEVAKQEKEKPAKKHATQKAKVKPAARLKADTTRA